MMKKFKTSKTKVFDSAQKLKISDIENKKKARKLQLSKKGAISHVEIILSFVIFIGFLLFLIAIIPLSKPVKSSAGLDISEREITKNVSIEMIYFTLVLNQSVEGCFFFPAQIEIEEIVVKNESGERVDAKKKEKFIYVNSSERFERFYNIYSSSEFEESDFKTESCIINLTQLKAQNLTDYEIGLTRRYNVLSYKNLEILNNTYSLNYTGLHEQFNMPRGEDFGFMLKASNGTEIIKAIKTRPERTEILVREIPVQVVYKDGKMDYAILNIQVW